VEAFLIFDEAYLRCHLDSKIWVWGTGKYGQLGQGSIKMGCFFKHKRHLCLSSFVI